MVKTACFRTSTLTSHPLPGLAQPQQQLTTRRVTRTQERSKDVDAAAATAVENAERALHASRPLEQPPSFCLLQYRRRKETEEAHPIWRSRTTFGWRRPTEVLALLRRCRPY